MEQAGIFVLCAIKNVKLDLLKKSTVGDFAIVELFSNEASYVSVI